MSRKTTAATDGKMYYSISEVAELLSISQSTLRYWEKELPSVNPRKSQGGTRKYTLADIEELRLIHRLVKEEGYTLDGAKNLLRRKRPAEMEKQDIIRRLETVRSELMGMIAEIDGIMPLE